MKKLTKKQTETLNFIKKFKEREEMPPTLKEIAKHFCISIPSAKKRLQHLQDRGKIIRTNSARGIKITGSKEESEKND